MLGPQVVEVAQDDPFAQRPRDRSRLPRSRKGRARPRPRPRRPRAAAPAPGTRPARWRARPSLSRATVEADLVQLLPGDHPPHVGALAVRGDPGDAGQRAERLRGGHHPVRFPHPVDVRDDAGQLRPHVLAQRGELGPFRRVVGQPVEGETARTQREGLGAPPGPRPRRRRSPGTRRRRRGRAAARRSSPNQRRTARNVSRASSSPGRTCSRTPVSSRTRRMTSSPLVASRSADVANDMSSSTSRRSAVRRASRDDLDKLVGTGVGEGAVAVEQRGQPQRRALARGRLRVRAGVGVDDQQPHRVGTHVQHAEPHASHASCVTCPHRRQGRPSRRASVPASLAGLIATGCSITTWRACAPTTIPGSRDSAVPAPLTARTCSRDRARSPGTGDCRAPARSCCAGA